MLYMIDELTRQSHLKMGSVNFINAVKEKHVCLKHELSICDYI